MKNLFVLIFLFISFQTFAQNDTINQTKIKYIETFDDFLLVKASVNYRGLDMVLSPRINGITQFLEPLWYRPSVKNGIGLGVLFKGLSISFGFKVAQNPILRDRQGESKYFDLQIHSYGKKLGYDIYYQQYQGYFIEDISNIINNVLTLKPLQRRDDIKLQNISANVFYVFNSDKFSYRAAFVHDQRQLKSAGSFILTGSLGYLNAKADSSFTTNNIGINFQPEAAFNQNNFYTFAITPGYAFTLIIKKHFYFSAGISGMVGLQYYENYGLSSNSNSGVGYFLKGLGRASAGLNIKRWIVGASLISDLQGLNTKYVQYRTNNLEISIFLAHRFKVKWMEGKKSFFEGKKK